MGLMDKFKNLISVPEDDYYDDTGSSAVYDAGRVAPEERAASSAESRTQSTGEGKVVSFHNASQLQVVLVKPENFEDASSIADHLNNKHTVVLNLEAATREVARRLVDFLSGVAYANGGQLKRVANCTFIITPYNVSIIGDLIDELESSGVFFGK